MMKPFALACAICAGFVAKSYAAELRVTLTGLETDHGRIGCALHNTADTFPFGDTPSAMIWKTASDTPPVCVFYIKVSGAHAVTVIHDRNENDMVDHAGFGMPSERWGVSIAAPTMMRAPRFDEAAFDMANSPKDLTINMDDGFLSPEWVRVNKPPMALCIPCGDDSQTDIAMAPTAGTEEIN